MPGFEVTTEIQAPPEACFDLARDVGLHLHSLAHTGERVLDGRTDGLIELDETVTWEARHLGMTRRMTVKITSMDRPRHFRDEQVDGPFKRFVHDHYFDPVSADRTRMRDTIDFASPFGSIGWCVDTAYLRGYLHRLIRNRGTAIGQALVPKR